MKIRVVAALTGVLLCGIAAAASAQTAPPAPAATAKPNPIPSGLEQDAINAIGGYVKGVFGWNDTESIGTVTYFKGYDMQLRMQLGRYRTVHLHRGTVINPRGWTLANGQYIDVRGRPQADGSLDADTITVHNP